MPPPNFSDVVYIGKNTLFYLEALTHKEEPDLTGDHGKNLKGYIEKLLIAKPELNLASVGMVVDIGGQNALTIKRMREVLKKENLGGLIIDVNPIVPALSPKQANIRYVIDDACSFISSENYDIYAQSLFNKSLCLFVMNNLLNVLSAKEGWKLLQDLAAKLKPRDYLIITGITPEQLEKAGKIRNPKNQDEGLIEYCNKGSEQFFKTALGESFQDELVKKAPEVEVLDFEDFHFPALYSTSHGPSYMEVSGKRILAIRKKEMTLRPSPR